MYIIRKMVGLCRILVYGIGNVMKFTQYKCEPLYSVK